MNFFYQHFIERLNNNIRPFTLISKIVNMRKIFEASYLFGLLIFLNKARFFLIRTNLHLNYYFLLF